VTFVLNGSQGVGARPIDVTALPVDALVSCGFKWLCGPYATGFCWLRPELADALRYEQGYWLAQLTGGDLSQETESRLRDDLGAARYDVFGTANFLNFLPWTAAIEYLLAQGAEAIAAHDQALVERLVASLEGSGYRFVSPTDADRRAAIVVVSAGERRNEEISRLLAQNKIDVALRAGNLRLSPHLYNTVDEIDRAVSVLRTYDR
jgi:selenocysteine lyase/cysteine desulfurase